MPRRVRVHARRTIRHMSMERREEWHVVDEVQSWVATERETTESPPPDATVGIDPRRARRSALREPFPRLRGGVEPEDNGDV